MTTYTVMVHYAPRKSPLCGVETWVAVFTDDPHSVAGCDDWLGLVAEDLEDHEQLLQGNMFDAGR